MPDRPPFPIPENLTPDTYCLCIRMPDDPIWKTVIAGLLFQPATWFNWQRDDENSGSVLAKYWRDIYNNIDWSNMSCCCNDVPPLIFRWQGTTYQKSSDGGVTWTDAPEYDYRNISTRNPDPNDLGIEVSKCQAANAIATYFKEKINQQITDDMGAVAILGVIAAALLLFLSEGTSAAITAQVQAVVAGILGVGVTAWQAAFTTTVWSKFQCIIEINMEDDLSFTDAGITGINNQLVSQLTGIVVPSLRGYVNAAGVVGMSNIARSGQGDPDATCCPDCDVDLWHIVVYSSVNIGTITAVGDDWIELTGNSVPDFGTPYNAMIQTSDDNTCCPLYNVELISGTLPAVFGVNCGDGRWPASPNVGLALPVPEPGLNTIYIRGDVANFVVRVHLHT
jgi:hypothetical protein